VKGIYDGKSVKLAEDISISKPCKVIVTFLDEDDDVKNLREYPIDEETFSFWKEDAENIYQDYLKKNKHEDR
jgi:hypothetical protein